MGNTGVVKKMNGSFKLALPGVIAVVTLLAAFYFVPFNTLSGDVRENTVKINGFEKRFDRLDNKIDKMDGKFDRSLEKLDAKFTARLLEMQTHIQRLDDKLDRALANK